MENNQTVTELQTIAKEVRSLKHWTIGISIFWTVFLVIVSLVEIIAALAKH